MTATIERHVLDGVPVGTVDLVQTTPRLVVCIDGFGDRDRDAFRKAVDTLRPIAWALHLALRAEPRTRGHQMAPLEAMWWTEDDGVQCWRAFVAESADIPVDLVDQVVRDVPAAKNLPAGRLLDVRIVDDGLAVQTLHIGRLDEVGTALNALVTFMRGHDLVPAGPRHDIYLSHVRRCLPEHMRTVIRIPVRPA